MITATISGVTILLSLTVFSQVLADTMPATSDAIPLLGKNNLGRSPDLLNQLYVEQPLLLLSM